MNKKRPKIIAIGMQKGGVGKTTFAVHLAGFLAKYGHKTLLLDMDGQASATSFFFDDILPANKTLAVLFDDDNTVVTHEPSIIAKTNYENLDIAPSCIAMVSAESGHFDLEPTRRLYYWIEATCQNYDYIVIDTPPALGRLTGNVLMVADYVVLPCLPEPQSVDAIPNYQKNLDKVLTIRPNVEMLGVIVNNYSARETAHKWYLDVLNRTGTVIGIIRHSTLFVNLSHNKQLMAFEPIVNNRQKPTYDQFEAIVKAIIARTQEK